MIELSEERFKKDLNELFHYGLCSTSIYKDYREIIDKQVKRELVNIRNHCRANNIVDENCTDEKLFERYQKFWAMSEPSLQQFYEQVQQIFAVPEDCVPKPEDIRASALACVHECSKERQKLENEIRDLIEKYLSESDFVDELKHRQKQMDDAHRLLAETWQRKMSRAEKCVKTVENFEQAYQKLLQMGDNSREATKNLLASRFVNNEANLKRNSANLEKLKICYV